MPDIAHLNPVPTQRRPVIAVCGSSAENMLMNSLAEAVGQFLAVRGATLVCGGGSGVMAAACRGAMGAGGLTVGILPGGSPDEANPYVQVAVATGMGHARNVIIVQTADAVIAVGGAYGTLSEIALARACGRPVVRLHTWELNDPLRPEPLTTVETPEEAVSLALRLASAEH